jgi:hypothetical protein
MFLRAAPALLLLLVPSVARAQATEPEPVAGENAQPPPAPVDVPPPAEPKPIEPAASATSSTVAVDDTVAHRPRPPRYVAYENGRLLLRDPAGILEISPSALLQFDTYGYAGPGVIHYQRPDGTGLKSGVAIRRARIELSGRVSGRWFFLFGLQAGGEGSSAVAPLNNFIGYDIAPMLKVQIGQFRIPFTMDNVTGVRWIEFLERSMTARVLGAPLTRDLGVMAWGGTDRSALWWALGYFGGEGGNRRSTDNRGDVVGRVLFRPLWKKGGHLGQAHFGVSGRYGRRDRTYVTYDAPVMTTPGGYTFWAPTYGTGADATRVLPSNEQSAVAAEVFVPFCCIDFRGEVVVVRDGRREVLNSSLQLPTTDVRWNNTERSGTLSGYSWYVQATWWPYGPTRAMGTPGNTSPPSEDHSRERALSIAVRYEQLRARYDSIDRSSDDNGVLIAGVRRGGLDAESTAIKVDALQIGATYWSTRHIKIMAQWSMFMFPRDNQVGAPGSKPNNEPDKRADARTFHELSARVQLSF